jgi:hypothetical protein
MLALLSLSDILCLPQMMNSIVSFPSYTPELHRTLHPHSRSYESSKKMTNWCLAATVSEAVQGVGR